MKSYSNSDFLEIFVSGADNDKAQSHPIPAKGTYSVRLYVWLENELAKGKKEAISCIKSLVSCFLFKCHRVNTVKALVTYTTALPTLYLAMAQSSDFKTRSQQNVLFCSFVFVKCDRVSVTIILLSSEMLLEPFDRCPEPLTLTSCSELQWTTT